MENEECTYFVYSNAEEIYRHLSTTDRTFSLGDNTTETLVLDEIIGKTSRAVSTDLYETIAEVNYVIMTLNDPDLEIEARVQAEKKLSTLEEKIKKLLEDDSATPVFVEKSGKRAPVSTQNLFSNSGGFPRLNVMLLAQQSLKAFSKEYSLLGQFSKFTQNVVSTLKKEVESVYLQTSENNYFSGYFRRTEGEDAIFRSKEPSDLIFNLAVRMDLFHHHLDPIYIKRSIAYQSIELELQHLQDAIRAHGFSEETKTLQNELLSSLTAIQTLTREHQEIHLPWLEELFARKKTTNVEKTYADQLEQMAEKRQKIEKILNEAQQIENHITKTLADRLVEL